MIAAPQKKKKKKRFSYARLLEDGMKPKEFVATVIKRYSDGKFDLKFLDGTTWCYSREQFFLGDPADFPHWFPGDTHRRYGWRQRDTRFQLGDIVTPAEGKGSSKDWEHLWQKEMFG